MAPCHARTRGSQLCMGLRAALRLSLSEGGKATGRVTQTNTIRSGQAATGGQKALAEDSCPGHHIRRPTSYPHSTLILLQARWAYPIVLG